MQAEEADVKKLREREWKGVRVRVSVIFDMKNTLAMIFIMIATSVVCFFPYVDFTNAWI